MLKSRWVLIVFLTASVVVFWPRPAHAYLDPGTINQMLQAGYLLLYSAMAVIAVFFRRIKDMFMVLRSKFSKK